MREREKEIDLPKEEERLSQPHKHLARSDSCTRRRRKKPRRVRGGLRSKGVKNKSRVFFHPSFLRWGDGLYMWGRGPVAQYNFKRNSKFD